MYYPSSENKGADQLCSYCTADLHLRFRIGKNLVFSQCGYYLPVNFCLKYIPQTADNVKYKPFWVIGFKEVN